MREFTFFAIFLCGFLYMMAKSDLTPVFGVGACIRAKEAEHLGVTFKIKAVGKFNYLARYRTVVGTAYQEELVIKDVDQAFMRVNCPEGL